MSVVVVGAGQAGLSVSHELAARGVEHVVLERGRIGQTWRGRWDSFCLVTPNWSVQLPGGAYDGADPDGFMPRDEIVAHLERYARSFRAPVREGVAVRTLGPGPRGFRLETDDGPIDAATVVLTTGAYQRPHRPAGVDALPASLQVLDAETYRGPETVAPGAVLVIGSGQTGCQLAEELRDAGRDVFLACGRAPWMTRRVGGVDTVRWLADIGFFEAPRSTLPAPAARLVSNPLATGHGRGHDLHHRTLQERGVVLLGRFLGVDGGTARFAEDVPASVAFGDAWWADRRSAFRELCAKRGVPAPDMPDPEPFVWQPRTTVRLGDIGAVIVTSGFRPDYTSWIRFPGAFDELGFPQEQDGRSTVVPGLFFCGVHFMRKRKSSLLLGVGEDAGVVAAAIAEATSPVA